MTDPDPEPQARSIQQWKIDLLQQIHDSAAEFRRIDSLGPDGYDGTDGDATKDWLDHLDALSAVREATERIALSAGIPQPWIERARTVGAGYSPTPAPDLSEEPVGEAKQFYLDMLSVDLWNLQRMAYVAAARELREAAGSYEFGRDPLAGAEYMHNMELLHLRVRALAYAAQLTHRDAEKLWGAEGNAELRQVTATAVNSWDNLTVEFAWRQYAHPSPASAVPPYLSVDDDAGRRHLGRDTSPPTPDQLIADAAQALREHAFVRSTPRWDIEIAVDAALQGDAEWQWGRESPEADTTATQPPPTAGPEP
ncbi:hypothetical protein ACFXO9_26775 [Nocardia tengchongensis]|uniref:hypothetical protein n=1 Tax=Nocardia tengchongensis TaxID=2055889 RepID=UPI0036AC6277